MVRHTNFNELYAKINWDQGYKSDLSYLGDPATGYLFNILMTLITLEILKALEVLCQELGTKTKYLFIYFNDEYIQM